MTDSRASLETVLKFYDPFSLQPAVDEDSNQILIPKRKLLLKIIRAKLHLHYALRDITGKGLFYER